LVDIKGQKLALKVMLGSAKETRLLRMEFDVLMELEEKKTLFPSIPSLIPSAN
jgi:hypothetical protein